MAKVKDKKSDIENGANYVAQSLIVKSKDEKGVVLKWLESNAGGTADRKEMFIATNINERGLALELRTVVTDIIVNQPQ